MNFDDNRCTVRSFAKVNLALKVTGTRDDGYHELETVMQKVSLADTIHLEWIREGRGDELCGTRDEKAGGAGAARGEVFCESVCCGEDDAARCQREKNEDRVAINLRTNKVYIPRDQRNLAYRGALAILREMDVIGLVIPKGRLNITVRKMIPVAAGLGGGSSNAAAVMVALNTMWGLKLKTKRLCSLGTELGADVPFCVLAHSTPCTCALGRGVGEKLTRLRCGLKDSFVLAKPAFGVSTKEVFSEIDSYLGEERYDINELIEGIETGDRRRIYENMVNDLELYTLVRYPEVEKLKRLISETQDVQNVMMTGSGPTVMGLYRRLSDAKKACEKLKSKGYEAYWCVSSGG